MAGDWKANKSWSDKFIPHIKELIASELLRHQISIAGIVDDSEKATDLIVMRAADIRIACRVRREAYQNKYSDEFTIRSRLTSGAKTELAKIMEGFGDYFVYGFSGKDVGRIYHWTIANLAIFRKCNLQPIRELPNTDGRTWLAVYEWSQFPSNFVVSSSRNAENDAVVEKALVQYLDSGSLPDGWFFTGSDGKRSTTWPMG